MMKGHSLDKIKDSVGFHSDINTLYHYRSNQKFDLKENPILALEYGTSEARNDWATHRNQISSLEQQFGKFDLDVYANHKNKVCETFFDKDQNGLELDGDGNLILCNPPYSQKNEFIEKARREAQTGKKILMLMPAFTKTDWFRELKAKSQWLFFLNGRLVFRARQTITAHSDQAIFDQDIVSRRRDSPCYSFSSSLALIKNLFAQE